MSCHILYLMWSFFGSRAFSHGYIFVESAQSEPVSLCGELSRLLQVTALHCLILSSNFHWKSTKSSRKEKKTLFWQTASETPQQTRRVAECCPSASIPAPQSHPPSRCASLAAAPRRHQLAQGASHLVPKHQRRADRLQQKTRQVY